MKTEHQSDRSSKTTQYTLEKKGKNNVTVARCAVWRLNYR